MTADTGHRSHALAQEHLDIVGRSAIRRVAIRILPILFLAGIVAGIDRFNVGYAALTMSPALGLSPTVYALGSSVFFLGFAIFELPSNMVLSVVGARRWLARIMVTWGFIVVLLAAAQGPKTFVAFRFLLGVAEAGFMPGALFYLSLWFPEYYRARVASLIILTVPLSSSISGPLAAAILPLDGTWGLAGWQWLFVLEGAPAVLLGLIIFVMLSDKPADAKWLPDNEREWLLESQREVTGNTHQSSWEEFRLAFRHPFTWAMAGSFALFSMGLPNLNIWLPTLLSDAGYGMTAIGWISAVPFLIGTIAMLLVARHSDKRGERLWHIMGTLGFASIAFAAASLPWGLEIKIVLMALGYVGLASTLPVFWSLIPTFLKGRAAAVGIGLISAIGNLGTFLGGTASGFLAGPNREFVHACLLFSASSLGGGLIILGTYWHLRRRTRTAPSGS